VDRLAKGHGMIEGNELVDGLAKGHGDIEGNALVNGKRTWGCIGQ